MSEVPSRSRRQPSGAQREGPIAAPRCFLASPRALKRTLLPLALLAMCAASRPLWSAAEDPADTLRVAEVINGHTVKLTDGRLIRLAGARSPLPETENEIVAHFAWEAITFAEDLLLERPVSIEMRDIPADGEAVGADLYAKDGTLIAYLLIANGLASYERAESVEDRKLYDAFSKAIDASAGMWALDGRMLVDKHGDSFYPYASFGLIEQGEDPDDSNPSVPVESVAHLPTVRIVDVLDVNRLETEEGDRLVLAGVRSPYPPLGDSPLREGTELIWLDWVRGEHLFVERLGEQPATGGPQRVHLFSEEGIWLNAWVLQRGLALLDFSQRRESRFRFLIFAERDAIQNTKGLWNTYRSGAEGIDIGQKGKRGKKIKAVWPYRPPQRSTEPARPPQQPGTYRRSPRGGRIYVPPSKSSQ